MLFRSTFINNSDATVTVHGATLTVNGVFTNSGTFTMTSGRAVFNGISVNQGTWVTDPTTNVFNATHIEYGSLLAAAGDVYLFKSNLVNLSTQNTTWSTLNTLPGSSGAAGTKFIFDGKGLTGTSLTQEFFTAGLALTGGFVGTPSSATETQSVTSFGSVTGFQDNFALDRLELGNAGTNSVLLLLDSFPLDGQTASLFVNDLMIFGTSRLIVSNDVRLYFVNSNNWSLANIQLLGNGEIHQLVSLNLLSVIPEPNVLLLFYAGLATLWFARRRVSQRR